MRCTQVFWYGNEIGHPSHTQAIQNKEQARQSQSTQDNLLFTKRVQQKVQTLQDRITNRSENR